MDLLPLVLTCPAENFPDAEAQGDDCSPELLISDIDALFPIGILRPNFYATPSV